MDLQNWKLILKTFRSLAHNVLRLTDSWLFSSQFWLGAVIGCPSFGIINNLKNIK
jgi:hypothetical protein